MEGWACNDVHMASGQCSTYPSGRPNTTPTRRPTARQAVGLWLDQCTVYGLSPLQKLFFEGGLEENSL